MAGWQTPATQDQPDVSFSRGLLLNRPTLLASSAGRPELWRRHGPIDGGGTVMQTLTRSDTGTTWVM